MTTWEGQLSPIIESFTVFDYAGLRRDDGAPIKDLRDFLRICTDDWEADREVRDPLHAFTHKVGKENHV
jgi:hypothetical protein